MSSNNSGALSTLLGMSLIVSFAGNRSSLFWIPVGLTFLTTSSQGGECTTFAFAVRVLRYSDMFEVEHETQDGPFRGFSVFFGRLLENKFYVHLRLLPWCYAHLRPRAATVSPSGTQLVKDTESGVLMKKIRFLDPVLYNMKPLIVSVT